jgi:hypothetical protein
MAHCIVPDLWSHCIHRRLRGLPYSCLKNAD